MQASNRSPRPFLLLSLASLLLLPACAGGDAAKPGDKAPAKTADKPAEPAQPANEGKIEGKPVEGEQKVAVAEGAEGKDFELQIDKPEAKVGEEGRVTIKVVPRGEWHMNLDFPTLLKLDAPAGVSVAKAEQKKADALKFDESSAEFAVAFTPSEAGDKAFTGEFKFAICQADVCSQRTEKLDFVVAVK